MTTLRVGEAESISRAATLLTVIAVCESKLTYRSLDGWVPAPPPIHLDSVTWVQSGFAQLQGMALDEMVSLTDHISYTQNYLHPVPVEPGLMETDSIIVPKSPSYYRNIEKHDRQPCLICGKPVRATMYARGTRWVHVHEGGSRIVTDRLAETLDPSADLGMYPIGADCWRKHPELHRFQDGGQADNPALKWEG